MTTQEYNGMSLQEATYAANTRGFSVKVASSGMQQLDCTYRPERITFKVENEIVVHAEIG